jgi:hypothetical protein
MERSEVPTSRQGREKWGTHTTARIYDAPVT